MNKADLINASFELIGALLLSLNCLRLYKDKKLFGVSMLPAAFYTGWGVWNLYFYPSNGFILSAIAGIFVVIANGVWVGMAIHYSRQNPKT